MVKSKPSAERSKKPGGKGGGGGQVQKPSKPSAPSFEVALEKLEGSVARLEEGDMPLEEALELFETGVKLSRECQSTLENAERRIEILVADRGMNDGDESAVDFDLADRDASDEDEDDESAFED